MPSVVVGAGILGAMTAYQLATRGHQVILLEARTIGSGASGGAGTRGLRANYRAVPELRLAARSGQLWRDYQAALGIRLRFGGNVLVTERPVVGSSNGLVSLQDRAWVQNNHGIHTQVVGRDELRELEPNLHERVAGGLFVPQDGDIDHDHATRAIAEAARAAGAQLYEGEAVTGLRVLGHDRAEVVTMGDRRIVADDGLFLFVNAGLREMIASSLGMRLPIWRLCPQLVRVRPKRPGTLRHALGHDHRPLTIRPLPDGDLLYAGRWRGRWDEQAGQGVPDPEAVRGHLEAGAETIPAIADAEILQTDASRPDTGSPDGLPIIDRVTGGVFFAAGWGGHGYGIAPAVAEALLDWHRNGRRPEHLADFRLARFGTPRATAQATEHDAAQQAKE